MRKFLYRFLFKKLLRNDFIMEMSEVDILDAYNRMNTEKILRLLKYNYTNLLASLVIAKKNEEDIVKGRILQTLGMIDSIETAEDSLLHISEVMSRRQQRSKTLEGLKNKLAFRRN